MDLAKALIRSTARAFYPAEQVLIVDAILLHSALRDDDLAFLMGQNVKFLRKSVGRLREDGIVDSQQRAEHRPGANRPFAREYYYINFHHAIDVIKYRLKVITREVETRYSKTLEEKKELRCPQCHNEYTELDVLDSVGVNGFVCKRCGHDLEPITDEMGSTGQAGHEVQSRLNHQLATFEKLMRQIDNTDMPENDFETALANALPVKRDANNPGSRSIPVAGGLGRLPPATVYGMKTEPEKIQVNMMDAEKRAQLAAAEEDRKAKVAAQNILPDWHRNSTVASQSSSSEALNGATPSINGFKSEVGDDEKKDIKPLIEDEEKKKEDNDAIDQYFASMQDDEDEDSDEESDDEDEDDEDEEDEKENGDRPVKRVKIDENSTLASKASTPGDSTPAVDSEDE